MDDEAGKNDVMNWHLQKEMNENKAAETDDECSAACSGC